MIVKKIKRRGGVEYVCDPERHGCGQKITPGQRRKAKRSEPTPNPRSAL